MRSCSISGVVTMTSVGCAMFNIQSLAGLLPSANRVSPQLQHPILFQGPRQPKMVGITQSDARVEAYRGAITCRI